MCLKLDNMEQDLILACKNWYGDKGIDKVISHYCGYNIECVNLHARYHFISELYLKLCDNNNLKYLCLLDRVSPRRIYDPENRVDAFNPYHYNLSDFPRIILNHMVEEIQGLEVKNNDIVLVKIHEANEMFIEEENE